VHVRILYFASFRDAVGRAEEDRQVPEGTCVRDLWSILAREVPLFGRYPVMPPAAINQLYQPPHVKLEEGDEVAFLPPVAGG
jgi:molybdopterin converting factor subunit 1